MDSPFTDAEGVLAAVWIIAVVVYFGRIAPNDLDIEDYKENTGLSFWSWLAIVILVATIPPAWFISNYLR